MRVQIEGRKTRMLPAIDIGIYYRSTVRHAFDQNENGP